VKNREKISPARICSKIKGVAKPKFCKSQKAKNPVLPIRVCFIKGIVFGANRQNTICLPGNMCPKKKNILEKFRHLTTHKIFAPMPNVFKNFRDIAALFNLKPIYHEKQN
jgi:hypothetical protein